MELMATRAKIPALARRGLRAPTRPEGYGNGALPYGCMRLSSRARMDGTAARRPATA